MCLKALIPIGLQRQPQKSEKGRIKRRVATLALGAHCASLFDHLKPLYSSLSFFCFFSLFSGQPSLPPPTPTTTTTPSPSPENLSHSWLFSRTPSEPVKQSQISFFHIRLVCRDRICMVSLFADTGQMQMSRPFLMIPATGVLKLDWRLAAPPTGMSMGFVFICARNGFGLVLLL